MKCRINRCLLVGVVFILAAGCAASGSMYLLAAADKGDTEKVQALLAKGADVNSKNIHGQTANTPGFPSWSMSSAFPSKS